MKKVLVLLLIAFVVQVSSLSGKYDNLNKYFQNSKTTQRCLENSKSWLPITFVTTACDCLDSDLAYVQKGLDHGLKTVKTIDEDMVCRATKKLSEQLRDHHDKQMVSIVAIQQQQDIMENVGLLEKYMNSPELLRENIVKDAELFREHNAYQDALNKSSHQALTDTLEKIKK